MRCDRTIRYDSPRARISGWFYRFYTHSVPSDDPHSAVGTEGSDDAECGCFGESVSDRFHGAPFLPAEGYDFSAGADLPWASGVQRSGHTSWRQWKWAVCRTSGTGCHGEESIQKKGCGPDRKAGGSDGFQADITEWWDGVCGDEDSWICSQKALQI